MAIYIYSEGVKLQKIAVEVAEKVEELKMQNPEEMQMLSEDLQSEIREVVDKIENPNLTMNTPEQKRYDRIRQVLQDPAYSLYKADYEKCKLDPSGQDCAWIAKFDPSWLDEFLAKHPILSAIGVVTVSALTAILPALLL